MIKSNEGGINLNEALSKLTSDMNTKKDQWLLETLRKNGVIISDTPTNGDIFFMQKLYKVEVFNNKELDCTDILMDGKLIGKWFNNYEPDLENGSFIAKAKYWN